MKLSDFMKDQMKYVSDDFMLEAVEKKPSLNPNGVISGYRIMEAVKKTARVAACFSLAVAAVIMFTLIRNSVENSIDDVTKDPSNNVTTAKLGEVMADLYTQNNEDIYLLKDNKKYENFNVDQGYSIGNVRCDRSGIKDDYKYFLTKEHTLSPGEDSYICNVEGCRHNSFSCMAFMPFKGWDAVALADENGDFEAYYVSGLMFDSVTFDGETWINPDYYSFGDKNGSMLFEINLKKGTKKAVAVGIPSFTKAEYYCNGYVLGKYDVPLYKAVSVDTRTGEWKTFDAGVDVEIVDIIDGYVYLLDGNGNLYRSDPSLSAPELIRTLEYHSGYDPADYKKPMIQAEIIGDKLYYRTNTEEFVYDEKGIYDFPLSVYYGDLYAVDLYDSEEKAVKLAEKVLMLCESEEQNKLYFTTFELINNGIYKKKYAFYAETTCGGSLYFVDADTNEVSTVFLDCGGDVSEIGYVSDDSIVFYGVDYRSILEGFEYDGENVSSVFKYNVKTGTVTNLGQYGDYYAPSRVKRTEP